MLKIIKIKSVCGVIAALTLLLFCRSAASAQTCGRALSYMISGDNAVITGCEGLPDVLEIPSRIEGRAVTEIRENAFYKCPSLTKVTVPKTVTKIGHHAFCGCDSLSEVRLEGGAELYEGCFKDCRRLSSVYLSDSIGRIGERCFYGCSSLSEIRLPHSLTELGESAFEGCEKITHTELPEGLLIVGERTFYGCGIKKAVIPDSVTQIGPMAFGYSGRQPAPDDGFIVSGQKDSLAGRYAFENSFTYEQYGETAPKRQDFPVIPALITIAAVIGLSVHRVLERAFAFEEYENLFS